MLVLALAAALRVGAPAAADTGAVDTFAVYSIVLAELHADHPRGSFVLAETRSGVECMPRCGAGLRDPDTAAKPQAQAAASIDHSPALIARLRRAGLVDATCPVRDRTFGCRAARGRVFLALGEVEDNPPGPPWNGKDGEYWVKVALLLAPGPCGGPSEGDAWMADGVVYWMFVKREEGRWRLVQRLYGSRDVRTKEGETTAVSPSFLRGMKGGQLPAAIRPTPSISRATSSAVV